ncbi:MAG: hypothetical protein WCS77_06105 [Elusimicrobiaceae bacterium]|jgi:hypothetical protein
MFKFLARSVFLALLLAAPQAALAQGAPKPAEPAKEAASGQASALPSATTQTVTAPQTTDAHQSGIDKAVGAALSALDYGEVEGPVVRFYARISGTTTAEGLIDIYAPFDGRVSDLSTELFQWVEKDQLVGVVASVELAAMLDASSEKTKETNRKRWKEMYDFYQLRAPITGIVVGLNVKNRQNVFDQEKLMTIARSIFIIAKTQEKVYITPAPGMLARIKDKDTGIVANAVLRSFTEIGKTGQYQVRLEITDRNWKIRPGMVFDGDLLLYDNPNSAMVPIDALIKKNGRTFLMTMVEVKPGARNEWYTEVSNVFPGETYIMPDSLLNIKTVSYNGLRVERSTNSASGLHDIDRIPQKTVKPAAKPQPVKKSRKTAKAKTMPAAEEENSADLPAVMPDLTTKRQTQPPAATPEDIFPEFAGESSAGAKPAAQKPRKPANSVPPAASPESSSEAAGYGNN